MTNLDHKQEKLMEFVSHIILWYLSIVVLVNYVQLIVYRSANILLPVTLLMIMGLVYWSVFILTGIYFHLKENGLNKPYTLITQTVLACFTFLSFIEARSALMLSVIVELPSVDFDRSFYLLFIVGFISAVLGLVKSIQSYSKKNNDVIQI